MQQRTSHSMQWLILGVISALLGMSLFIHPLIGAILGNFSYLPLMMALFSGGVRDGVMALVAKTVLTAALLGAQTSILQSLPLFVVMMVGGTLVFEKKSRSYTNSYGEAFSKTLLILVIGGAIAILAAHFWADIKVAEVLGHYSKAALSNAMPMGLAIGSEFIAFLPAMIMVSWVMIMSLNAYGALVLLKRQKRLKRAFDKATLATFSSQWDVVLVTGVLLMLSETVMDLGVYEQTLDLIGRFMVIVSLIPLFMKGMAVLKMAMKKYKINKIWYHLYLVSSLLFLYPLLVVALVGFVDPLYHLSKRLMGQSAS